MHPPQKKSAIWIPLVITMVIGGLGLFCCLGCGGMLFFIKGFSEQHFANQLRDLPTTKAFIGEIESFSYNYGETGQYGGGGKVVVYNVTGSRSRGIVVLKSDNQNEIIWAVFRRPDGPYMPLVGAPDIELR